MNPFVETITSKKELYADFLEFAKKRIELGQNAMLAHYGLFHGEAIMSFCDGKVDELMKYANVPLTSIAYFQAGFNAWKNLSQGLTSLPETNNSNNTSDNKNVTPLQQIFYGAPGTGKSYAIKELTKGKKVIRTTFHPDSDYSTFVGAYKPTMRQVKKCVIIDKEEKEVKSSVTKDDYEHKIVYSYVKQAFLKAYLAAWKKYSEGKKYPIKITTTATVPITFDAGGKHYTFDSVEDSKIYLISEFEYGKKAVKREWGKLWPGGEFILPTGEQSGKSLEHAIAKWIHENIESCTKDDFEKGWAAILAMINKGERVEVSKNPGDSSGSQTYFITKLEGKEDKIWVKADKAGNDKETLRKYFIDEKSISKDLYKELINIFKSYNSEDFDDAWEQLKNNFYTETKTTHEILTYKPQYLIIEEINRGNCAQIFGDLFQLLDRSDNGYSTYPIDADTDIQQEIERAFKEDEEYKVDSLTIEPDAVEDYQSNYNKTLEEDILHGRVLLLPPNLYIWATMNTSDQSLFPIDSAFKRRWDWKYIKISKGKDKFTGKELEWKIQADNEYDWWDFITRINEIIYRMTSSADKQLGFFFCQANNGIIDADTFVNKVVFYLWNDVFKDFAEENSSLFKFKKKDEDTQDSDITFPDFFDEKGDVVTRVVEQFIRNVKDWKKNDNSEK